MENQNETDAAVAVACSRCVQSYIVSIDHVETPDHYVSAYLDMDFFGGEAHSSVFGYMTSPGQAWGGHPTHVRPIKHAHEPGARVCSTI